MTIIIIAIAIVIAGWLIANAINPQNTALNVQNKNDNKIQTNARKELDKLLYQLSLKHYTDAQILNDPTANQLLKLEFHNYPRDKSADDFLFSQITIRSQKRSASYFINNKDLLRQFIALIDAGYDDEKIAKELSKDLKQLDTDVPSHMPGHLKDEYQDFDITRMRVDPHMQTAIKMYRNKLNNK